MSKPSWSYRGSQPRKLSNLRATMELSVAQNERQERQSPCQIRPESVGRSRPQITRRRKLLFGMATPSGKRLHRTIASALPLFAAIENPPSRPERANIGPTRCPKILKPLNLPDNASPSQKHQSPELAIFRARLSRRVTSMRPLVYPAVKKAPVHLSERQCGPAGLQMGCPHQAVQEHGAGHRNYKIVVDSANVSCF